MKSEQWAQARAAARLAAVQALYQQEMQGLPTTVLLHEFHQHRLGATIEDATYHDAEVSFFDDVVTGVGARLAEIDEALTAVLPEKWAVARLDRPLRALLRAGIYELLARADIPTKAIINEYLDIADAFYDKRERGFVNGVLDAAAGRLRNG